MSSAWFHKGLLCISLIVALLLGACTSSTQGGGATKSGGTANSPVKVGATSGGKCGSGSENYYWVSGLATLPLFVLNDHPALFRTAQELGVCAHVVGPAQNDPVAQVAAIEQTCAGHPAGVMVVGLDASLASAINKCIDERVPTVTIDVDVPNSKRLSFIGGNFVSLGVFIADNMIQEQKDLKGRTTGEIAVTDNIQTPSNAEIVSGIKSELEKRGWTYLGQQDDKDTAEGGAAAAHALISAYPNLSGIISLGSEPGPGVVQAVKEAGKTGEVLVTAGQHDRAFAEKIKTGELAAFFGPERVNITQFGLIALYQFNHPVGTVSGLDKWQFPPIPPFIDVGAYAVDRHNVDAWLAASQNQ